MILTCPKRIKLFMTFQPVNNMADMNASVTNVSLRDNSGSAGTTVYTHPYFDLVMGTWLPGSLCVLGTIGNTVSLYVLSRYEGHNITFYSLRALATSDIVLLTAAFIQQIIPMVCLNLESRCWLCNHIGYLRVYAWPVVCVGQLASIWMTILISFERYRAICMPLHNKSRQHLPIVRRAVLVITVASIVFNIPKFFEFYPEHINIDNGTTKVDLSATGLRSNIVYRYLYNTALTGLLLYALPIIILLYLNSMIVYKLRKAIGSLNKVNRRQQMEYRATKVPLCIVVVFILCNTNAFISFVLDAVYVDSYGSWQQYYTAISNILVITNSAVNFVIFYMFGTKFRKLLWHCIICCRRDVHLTDSTQSPIFRRRFNTLDYESTYQFCRGQTGIELTSTKTTA